MLSAQYGDQNNAEVEGIGKACCFEPFALKLKKISQEQFGSLLLGQTHANNKFEFWCITYWRKDWAELKRQEKAALSQNGEFLAMGGCKDPSPELGFF